MTNKNELITLTITDSGMNGEGVAKWNDLTVFVPGVLVGEQVLAKVVERKKTFMTAKVVKVLKASENRVTPPCAIYFSCGGCNLQHVNYQTQLQMKQQHVLNTLGKQLKVPFTVNKVLPSDKPFGYRNKAQLPVGQQNGKVVLGFYKTNSHQIVPLTTCPLHEEWLDVVMEAFLAYANQNNVSVYNEKTGKGLLRHLVVRNIYGVLTVMVVVNGQKLPSSDKLVEQLNNVLKNRYTWSLYVNQNTKQSNVILGNVTKLVHGQETFDVEVMGVTVTVSPMSFFQVNNYISKAIYAHVLNLVKGKNNVVVDAYSGAGLLTTLIAKEVKQAIGIEIISEAVADANLLKEKSKVNNVTHYCGDVKTVLPNVVSTLNLGDNQNFILVLDPPRKGCEQEVLQTALQVAPKEIVYVSCNPATLARDLAMLCNDGLYEINLVQPYDMFPQTSHVETVVWLNKRKRVNK